MKSPIGILLPVIKQHRLLLFSALLCALIDGILRVVVSAGVGVWVGQVLQLSSGKSRLWDSVIGVNANMNIGMVVLVALKVFFAWSAAYLTGRTSETVARLLREQQFEHHLQLDLATHLQKAKGKYLLRYSGDMVSVQAFVTKGILLFFADMAFLTAAAVMLSFISWHIPLYIAVWLFFCIIPVALVSYRLRKTVVSRRDHRSMMLNFISQRLASFFTIKAFNRETPEYKRFEKQSARIYKYGLEYHYFASLQTALAQLAVYGALLITLWYFSRHTAHALVQNITMVTLIIFYTIPVLKRLLRTSIIWQNGLISLQKLNSFPRLQYPAKKEIQKLDGRIVLKAVAFSFPEAATPLFSEVSLQIQPHGITYIIGKSGSGKSTLLELMAAMRKPGKGTIWLDGKSYAQIHPFILRKQVALLCPDAKLLGNTVFEAISYSRRKEKEANVMKILNQIGFSLKGLSPTDWLKYSIGDHGEKLSDSEKQLIALARTLVSPKKILLLDEPFAHLDEAQQEPIIEILKKLSTRHTIVITGEQVNNRLPSENIYFLTGLHTISHSAT